MENVEVPERPPRVHVSDEVCIYTRPLRDGENVFVLPDSAYALTVCTKDGEAHVRLAQPAEARNGSVQTLVIVSVAEGEGLRVGRPMRHLGCTWSNESRCHRDYFQVYQHQD